VDLRSQVLKLLKRYDTAMQPILKIMDKIVNARSRPGRIALIPPPTRQSRWLLSNTFAWMIVLGFLSLALMALLGLGLTIYAGVSGIGTSKSHPSIEAIYCLAFAGIPALLFMITLSANLWRYRSLPRGYIGEQLRLC